MGEPLSHKCMTSHPAGMVRVPAALQPTLVQTNPVQATTGSKSGHAAAVSGQAYLGASITASRSEGHQLCRVRGSLGEAPHQVLPLGWYLPNGERIAGRCRTGHMQQHASTQQPTAHPGTRMRLRAWPRAPVCDAVKAHGSPLPLNLFLDPVPQPKAAASGLAVTQPMPAYLLLL